MERILQKITPILISVFILLMSGSRLFSQTEFDINPAEVLHQVDPKIYGHFLEHIYNSVNGGLWGELIWNRSLERFSGGSGSWAIEGDAVVQSSLNENVRLLIGDTTWRNYEFRLEARKDDGAEGFLIIFRANGENFYWCNLGGWSNTQHAIEKGVPGVRWGVFGNPIPGAINTGQWYNIRIRCQGNHFQVWLNNNKIFDFTDGSAHLAGQVGVGTWVTKARYRNLRVTEIAGGDTLFQGLPALREEEAVLQNWTKFGDGAIYRSEPALNSQSCIKIVNSGTGEAGLQQGSINLKSQSYHGSFWARGSAPGGLCLQLRAGATLVAEQLFPPPTNDWQEFPFDLVSPRDATNGSLRLTLIDTGTVYLDQISLMGQDAIDNDGLRPDLFEAINDLRPPVIRWPGGYFAEFYRWKDGVGPQHQRGVYPLEAWNDQDVNSFGTDEFITLCRKVGAEPIIVINIGHRSSPTPQQAYIEEAQHWLEYCNGPVTSEWGAKRAANGFPEPYRVKFWEISNEVWLTRNATTYVSFLRAFVPALKQIDPSIKIIACGSGGFDQSWNQTILANCAELIDYISTHHYEDIAAYKTGVQNYHNFLRALSGLIANSANPNIKIYMSEWNVWSGLDWRNGLYAGGMLNTFEKNGATFAIGGPALFLRHTSATDWNNAFINFSQSAWFPAPNYVVMKFWRDHYAPNFLQVTGRHADLNVVATLSADGQTLFIKVISTTAAAVPVQFNIANSFQPKSLRAEQIAPASLATANTMTNPNAIQVETGAASLDGQAVNATVPAYGAVILTTSQGEGSGVGYDREAYPQEYRLYANQPNPFNPSTVIRYDVPRDGRVSLRIVDILGHSVKILFDEFRQRGSYAVEWDGRNQNGKPVSSGVYVYELKTESRSLVKKMSLVR